MLQHQISLAEKVFLEPAKLDQAKITGYIKALQTKYIDYADLYFQEKHSESWYLEENIVKSGNFSASKGVGIRNVSHDKAGLAFSEDLSQAGIEDAVNIAKNIANTLNSSEASNNKIIKVNSNYKHINQNFNLYSVESPLNSVTDAAKIHLLQYINNYARSLDNRIQEVIVNLMGTHEVILIATSGSNYNYIADLRPLIRLNIRVIAREQHKLEQGFSGGGGRFNSYQIFIKDNFALAEKYTQQAVNLAITNLSANIAPAGRMPVILGSGWPGILLHEAVGHGLEGDAVRKGGSVFANKLGDKVASNLCTIVDNGQLINQRGSLHFDDEGTPTQNTILIENGILKGYLQDQLNAKLTNQQSTGNSRRQSYAHLPIPRMTNTYMLPGSCDPADIIKSVSKGIYATNFSGGQVDVTSGKFVFEANEAYLIENGKIATPIKGATLIGDGTEVLQKIVMVGNDLNLDPGIGTCGKEGQSVPVSVGQPTLLIEELTVGGTDVSSR